MILGDGGNGESESGRGVVGSGDIMGVRTFLRGEGGIGDSGGDGGESRRGLNDLLRSVRKAGVHVVSFETNIECLLATIVRFLCNGGCVLVELTGVTELFVKVFTGSSQFDSINDAWVFISLSVDVDCSVEAVAGGLSSTAASSAVVEIL